MNLIDPRLQLTTNLTEFQLIHLHKRFKSKFKKVGGMTKSEFIEIFAAGKEANFFAGRLYDIFLSEAQSRQVNGMDFQAFAHAVSSTGPSSPLEEKMFVCFKVFDLNERGRITKETLCEVLAAIFKGGDLQKQLTTQQIEKVVELTFIEADCSPTNGMKFMQFRKIFIRSPVLKSQFLALTRCVETSTNIFSFPKRTSFSSCTSSSNENVNHLVIRSTFLLKQYEQSLLLSGISPKISRLSASPRNLKPFSYPDSLKYQVNLDFRNDSFSSSQTQQSGDDDLSPIKPTEPKTRKDEFRRSTVDATGRRHSSSITNDKRSRLSSTRRLSEPNAKVPFFTRFFTRKSGN